MSESVAAAANANGSTTYTVGESFHFALNNMILKDNRIPPRSFTNANFESIQAAPVGYSYPDGAYFDMTTYDLPSTTFRINVKLLYQTVSKEYIDFYVSILSNSDSDFISNTLSVYPNPANERVNLSFNLKKQSYVRLDIYDLEGKKIETVFIELSIMAEKQ